MISAMWSRASYRSLAVWATWAVLEKGFAGVAFVLAVPAMIVAVPAGLCMMYKEQARERWLREDAGLPPRPAGGCDEGW